MLRKHLVLIALLFLGFLIRIYKINELPLYGDELTIVYDSYSLLKTAKDSTGEFLPLTFSMGAGRPAGYVYLSIPFVQVFGPSALGVRMLSILSGLGTILVAYLLARKIFSNKVGNIAAFLVAISPLSLSLSRGGFESNFALFLAGLGLYLFLCANSRKYFYAFWALCWGIAIHTYPTFKLSLLLLLPVLLLYSRLSINNLKNKFVILSVVFLAIFSIFSLRETLGGKSEERFLSINIFSDKEIGAMIVQKVNYERLVGHVPSNLKKIFYNKVLEYGKLYVENYSKNFTFDYLFLNGDGNPRHNPSENGILYFVEVITISVGIFSLIKNKEDKKLKMLIAWILIVPVATALVSGPHNLRNSFLLYPFVLISAYGFSTLKTNAKIVVLCLMMIQAVVVLQRFYFLAPAKFASFWSENASRASRIAINNYLDFQNIILSDKIDNLEFAYPVYAKIDPTQVMSQANKNGHYKKFDKVLIGNFSDLELKNLKSQGKTLYIGDKTEVYKFEDVNYIESSDASGGIFTKEL